MLHLGMWGLLHIEAKHFIELGISHINVLLRLFLHASKRHADHALATMPIDFLESFPLLHLHE